MCVSLLDTKFIVPIVNFERCCWQVCTMFIVNLVDCHCLAYSSIALLAEVNTIFLHTRKLLQMSRVSFDSLLYRINAVINIATFLCCRFVCLVWILYGIVVYRDIVGPCYLLAISSSTFIMVVINIVLFWRLLSSDFLRQPSAPSGRCSKKDEDGIVLSSSPAAASNKQSLLVADGIKKIRSRVAENGYASKMCVDFDGMLGLNGEVM